MDDSLSVSNVFKNAWVRFKPVWWKLVLIFLGLFILDALAKNISHDGGMAMGLFGSAASFFIFFLSSYLVPRLGLMAVHNEKIGLLAIINSIIYSIGFILLIIPGIIAIVRFGMSGFALVDERLNPIDALKRSLALTKGHSLDIFAIGFVFLAFMLLLGVITLGIGFAIYDCRHDICLFCTKE